MNGAHSQLEVTVVVHYGESGLLAVLASLGWAHAEVPVNLILEAETLDVRIVVFLAMLPLLLVWIEDSCSALPLVFGLLIGGELLVFLLTSV